MKIQKSFDEGSEEWAIHQPCEHLSGFIPNTSVSALPHV